MSRPDGSIRTRATAAVTKRTAESGPDTVTGSCDTTGSRTSRPGGTSPRSTLTGTSRLTSGSRRTATRAGVKSITWIRGSTAVTVTGTLIGWAPATASTPARSIVAVKLDEVTGGRSVPIAR